MIDFHNHVIPGVDDGASDPEEAAKALRAFAAQGVTGVIATPHVDGSLTLRPAELAERLREIDAGWARLSEVAASDGSDVQVWRGAEVMLDTPEPEIADERLRLAGGRFALVEYPFMSVPPQSSRVLRHLLEAGVTPVLAHPERYQGMLPDSPLPSEWKAAGALLQVNAGSLTGKYGPQARSVALGLLEHGLVDYICSDYHARGRPATAGARELLVELDGAEHAELLMKVNPGRLLEGLGPLPVPPLRAQQGLWQRFRRWIA